MAETLPPPYPLLWPADRKRRNAHQRVVGSYAAANVSAAVADLSDELVRCKIRIWELTSNQTARSKADLLDDPAASLWFVAPQADLTQVGKMMVIGCDKFTKLSQNIRGISLTMQRLRLVDEIGAYSFVQAVEGARALPPPASEAKWWVMLGVHQSASLQEIEAAYKRLAKKAHPDAGGSREAWDELERAITQARKERG